MLKLTTKKKKWYVFPQDPSGEAQVEIVHLKPGEIEDINAEVNRFVGKKPSDSDDFVTEIETVPNLRLKLIVDKAITNLKGFKDEKGKEMKCTRKNKLKILAEWEWFYEQIEEFREDLAKEVEEEQEGAEKN